MQKLIVNFEDYLRDKHAEDYVGLDDDMVEACEDWIADLDVDDLIHHANQYCRLMMVKTINDCQRVAENALRVAEGVSHATNN